MNSELVEELVRRSQQGDVAAFERLIAAHVPLVRRFARAFVRSPEAADDLAQDALLKVYRSIAGYRFQSSFSTWLYAIVRNVYLDDARSRAGRERAAERPLGAGGVDDDPTADPDAARADHRLLREEVRRRVWAALAEVPQDFRTTLVLFDIEGLTYEEIAAIESAPLGTVKSRLSRGREHLRRLLGGKDPGAEEPRADAREDDAGNRDTVRLVRRKREPA
jgi:RNA polymerase sigma-70 factor (ECF subfamily)